ncbi:MAG: 6-phosphogluconolactonase [Opitutus sp.]
MNPPSSQHTVIDRLSIEVHPDRAAAGRAAARAVATHLRDVVASRGGARVIFACAPSQDEFLAALIDPAICGITVPWSKLTAFHMDDYVGLRASQPQSFRHYLQSHLLQHVPMGKFHPLPAERPDATAVCDEYSRLLSEKPIDLICLGIGENGHIAFNDPPVDFDDPAPVKIVELDEACRHQQVADGCFPSFDAVPPKAVTLTIPVFRQARRLSVHVFGPRKAAAVRATLRDPISPRCPASILRTHPWAGLYLDPAAAAGAAL